MTSARSRAEEPVVLPAWALPLIVAAIASAIVGSFYVGGPGLGLTVGGLAAAAVVVLAVRATSRGPIVSAPPGDLRRHFLLVSRDAIEDPQVLAQVVELCGEAGPDPAIPALRLLLPVRERFLSHWCCDLVGHTEAQQSAVVSLAALAIVDLDAGATIGDGDIVQAVEDELRTYPCTDVVLLTRRAEFDAAERSAAELRARLEADFLHLLFDTERPVGKGQEGAGAHRVPHRSGGPPPGRHASDQTPK